MKFSVIIPVYNVAPYLRECLDSVCEAADRAGNRERGAGNSCDVEIICVDDGATDGSAAILDEYAGLRSNNQTISNQTIFRVIHQKNAGVGAARNVALDVATGEYVVFVDGDDGLVRNALEILEQEISATNADIIQYGYTPVKSLTESVHEATVTQVRTFDLEKRNDARQAYRQVVGSLIAWNGCYRRDVIRDVRFLPIPNGEDTVWGAECFCHSTRVAVIDARIYRYVSRGNSAARTMSLRHVKSSLCSARRSYDIMHSWGMWASVNDILPRKMRSGMMGSIIPQINLLSPTERGEALECFYDCLEQIAWSGAARLVACVRSRFLLFVLLEIPFAVRARLAKLKGSLFK